MKYTTEQIKEISLSANSHAEAMATLYQKMREEIEQERTIRRSRIQFSIQQTFKERLIPVDRPSEISYALAEGALAAAGWTIVDDTEDGGAQYEKVSQFAEAVEKLRDLFKDIENLAGRAEEMRSGTEWRPIEEAPKDGSLQIVVNCVHNQYPDHARYTEARQWVTEGASYSLTPQPTHYLPIPPLPEGK